MLRDTLKNIQSNLTEQDYLSRFSCLLTDAFLPIVWVFAGKRKFACAELYNVNNKKRF